MHHRMLSTTLVSTHETPETPPLVVMSKTPTDKPNVPGSGGNHPFLSTPALSQAYSSRPSPPTRLFFFILLIVLPQFQELPSPHSYSNVTHPLSKAAVTPPKQHKALRSDLFGPFSTASRSPQSLSLPLTWSPTLPAYLIYVPCQRLYKVTLKPIPYIKHKWSFHEIFCSLI